MRLSLGDLRPDLQTVRGDVFGGITAAVVSLPLALAFGVASGLGAVSGMYGAIAAGLFAALSGGTRTQITSPTGPMAVAVAVVVTAQGPDNLAEVFTVVIMAGLIQVLLGVLRIGRFIAYTPYSVISGFMSGIGLIIILVQTMPFVGKDIAEGGPLGAVGAWPDAFAGADLSALAIAVFTLVVVVGWPGRLRQFLPPALAALIAGTLLAVFWLGGTPVIGDVPTGLPSLELPDLSAGALAGAVLPALTIALLGSIDTLLTSLVADSMTRTRHDPNRTLVGQGVGNMAAGFIGGTPGAGATMGTVVNIRAGGTTPLSGVLCALILAVLVLGLGRYVEAVPHAVLAGILMKVGWDIIDWRFVRRVGRVQREHLLVMVVTLGLTVFLDLVTAVAIGLIVAGMASARQFERLELDSVVSVPLLDKSFLLSRRRGAPQQAPQEPQEPEDEEADDFAARVGLVSLKGSFSVASSNRLINTITGDIRDHEVVILDFSETVYIDDSAALVVEQLIESAAAHDTSCIVMGLSGRPAETLRALDVLDSVPGENIVAGMDEARELATRILEPPAPEGEEGETESGPAV